MRLPVLVVLAWRSLACSPLTSVLLVLAVTVGVAFQVPNTANLDGYTAELLRLGVGRDGGDAEVLPRGVEHLTGAHALAARIRRIPGVARVAVQYWRAGVVVWQGKGSPARLVGLDADGAQGPAGLCRFVAQGRCLGPDMPGAVLGAALADDIHARPGDKVTVMSAIRKDGMYEPWEREWVVHGVLARGGGFGSDQTAFVDLGQLAEFDAGADAASRLLLHVRDPDTVAEVARRVEAAEPAILCQPWWQVHTFVASAVAGNRTLAAISAAMSMLAVAVPVLALFAIAVLRERPSIAVLVALGFARGEVFVLYLLKSALLATLGSVCGAGLGLLLCAWFRRHPIYEHDGFAVRPLLGAATVLVPVALLAATTVAASLVPAWLAARANVSATLRGA